MFIRFSKYKLYKVNNKNKDAKSFKITKSPVGLCYSN